MKRLARMIITHWALMDATADVGVGKEKGVGMKSVAKGERRVKR